MAASPRIAERWTLAAPLAVLLALAGLLATSPGEIDRGLIRGAMARELVRLADLAGLRRPDGHASEMARMPVTVIQEGGPGWIRDEAEAAVQADPIFTPGEPHLLRVEVVSFGRTYGVRGQLWRQGWSLRAPDATWVTPAPWVVVLSLLAGAGWAALRRRVAGGWVVAGLLAQLLARGLPWPSGQARPSVDLAWRDGPLGHGVVSLARVLPESSVAIGAGVVTLCAVLMLFDHRRSPEEGGGLVAAGMFGVAGALAWFEASLRVGLGPWLLQPAGWMAMAGAAGLWAWAWRRRRPTSPGESA